MKDEYDFSNAEQVSFIYLIEQIELPIYLETVVAFDGEGFGF